MDIVVKAAQDVTTVSPQRLYTSTLKEERRLQNSGEALIDSLY